MTFNGTVGPDVMTECHACGRPFTPEEWDVRHSDSDGEDVHEECCDVCSEDEVNVRELTAVFLAATDDLPDDAEDGIRAVLAHLAHRSGAQS